jgi:hypothetical protein
MTTPLVKPAPIVEPFAINGQKNTIPVASNPTPGGASLNDGFPALTLTPVSQGGVPPSGKDFNGLFNWITSHLAWMNGGGQYTFDAALSTFIGGYPVGAILQSNDGLSSYVNVLANNTTDFNTTPSAIGVSWMPSGGAAVSPQGVSAVTTTGGTTTLTNAQAVRRIISITGALTSNAVIVLPAIARDWIVVNATTGAYTLTVKTASDAGVTVQQGSFDNVLYNGTAIISQLVNTALLGTPTAPTPPSNDSSTRIATMAAIQTAIATVTANTVPQYKTASFTAGVTGDYWTDTTSGAFTMTLPDPPVGANLIRVQDVAGAWGGNPLAINPGTKTILGSTSPLVCDVGGEFFEIWYNGSDWRLA